MSDLNKNLTQGVMEAVANCRLGDPGDCEAQIADLLSIMKAHSIANTVWISADVHYASAIHYEPERTTFKDVDPFWKIVAGPINAGSGNVMMNPLTPRSLR